MGSKSSGREDGMSEAEEQDGPPMLTAAEAIALVRRWLEVDGVDPEGVFVATGETVLRYGDLIPHLEQGTPDGTLLLFAISRGRGLRQGRAAGATPPLQIQFPPPESEAASDG
jgi:hypothetical protein